MLDLNNIPVNEAGLLVTSTLNHTFLWTQAVDCFSCDFVREGPVFATETPFKFSSITNWNLELRNAANETQCRISDTNFGEEGVYAWNFNGSCNPIETRVKPINSFQPIVLCELFFIVVLALRYMFYRNNPTLSSEAGHPAHPTSSPVENDQDGASTSGVAALISRCTSSPTLTKQDRIDRVKSLDAFRGLCITLMIFVNYGGGKYWYFEHAPWNGVTVADVVFPWFAWIMGVGIAIQLKQKIRNHVAKSTLLYNIGVRSLKLIVIGLVLTNFGNGDLSKFRIPGVLQRLGITYFFVASLEALFVKPQCDLENSKWKAIEDLIESWKQWVIVIGCVAVHTAVTFFLRVPGCPTGYLGPGGLHAHSSYSNCTGGAAGYIDKLILQPNHIYSRPTCRELYKCDVPYDPEGLLGILTSILCVYLGVHTGRILLVYRTANQRLLRLLLWGVATIGASLWLCNFSVNGGLIPLNKNLWSLSYVLFCSGLAFLVFSILYFHIDKWKISPMNLTQQAGANAIFLYIGHSLTYHTIPWQWKAFNESSYAEYLIMDLWGTLLWLVAGVILYRRQIFIVL